MQKILINSSIRNITISGRVASGSTTLSRALAEKIGWKLWNGGEIYRQYAKENKIPLEKTNLSSDKYHLELDMYIKEKLKKENQIIMESWLSGFDAKGIDGIFKIFTSCSNDAVRIERLINREKMTVEEAKNHIKTREEENLQKWERLYHTRDIWNPALYDLVIDTYKYGPVETLNIAIKALAG